MPVSLPVPVNVPSDGTWFAESVHAGDFRMGWRREAFHKLLFIQRGRAVLHSATGLTRRKDRGAPGTIWVIPAGREHRIEDETPSVILLLCLGGDWLRRGTGGQELWAALVTRNPSLTGHAANGEWERLWRRALLEQERNLLGASVRRDAFALELLVGLARRPGVVAVADSALTRVQKITCEIDETFPEHWSVDVAASRAGLSRRHFTQCFREVNGRSFLDYLTDRRLVHAERLLGSGRHTVTGAAFSAGFQDLAHFYRLFKRRHGVAPGAWIAQQQARGKDPAAARK